MKPNRSYTEHLAGNHGFSPECGKIVFYVSADKKEFGFAPEQQLHLEHPDLAGLIIIDWYHDDDSPSMG